MVCILTVITPCLIGSTWSDNSAQSRRIRQVQPATNMSEIGGVFTINKCWRKKKGGMSDSDIILNYIYYDQTLNYDLNRLKLLKELRDHQ